MEQVTSMSTPDATHQPQAYRDALLEIVGDRDPLAVMAATPQRVRELLAGRDEAALAVRPTGGEWSATDVVGHMVDVEMVFGFRWRLTLTCELPAYPGYDEKRWARLPRPSCDQLRTAFEALRACNLWLLREVPRADWERVGVHGEQGPETVDVMVRKIAGHDLLHLDQLARTR